MRSLLIPLLGLAQVAVAQPGAISSIAPMMDYREAHVLAEVNGGVLAVGGFDGSATTTSCEWYEPAMDMWMPAASLPGPRQNATAHTINDDVFVIGGWDGDVTNHDDILHYDASTDGWTVVATMSSGRSGHGSAVIGPDQILICGGYDGSADLASCDLFDVTTFAVEPVAPMVVGRSSFAMMADPLNPGNAVVAGGYNPDAGFQLASAEHFDGAQWNALPDLPVAVDNLAGAYMGGDALQGYAVTGGRVYNPVANLFEGTAAGAVLLTSASGEPTGEWLPFDLALPHSYHVMAAQHVSWDAGLFMSGGADQTGSGIPTTFSPAEAGLYSTDGYAGSPLPDMYELNGRFRPAFTRLGDDGYFIGGDADLVGTGWRVDLTPVGSVDDSAPSPLQVFPNPAHGRVVAPALAANEPWTAFDGNGQVVATGTGPSLDLRALSPGRYVLTSATGKRGNVLIVSR